MTWVLSSKVIVHGFTVKTDMEWDKERALTDLGACRAIFITISLAASILVN